MKILALLSVSLLMVHGCEKKESSSGSDMPECIRDKIDMIAAGEVWNPPARIYSYRYRGSVVFYFPSRCCDIPGVLYDHTCNVICAPDGGFSGDGDGQCPDFFDTRSGEELIWEDTRE